ncbi:transposase [Serratia marcescens]|nr:transposase [Serratia marcescens]
MDLCNCLILICSAPHQKQVNLLSARELCRKHAISDATFYSWRKKYGGMEVPEVKRLESFEEENTRLKKLLAEAMLDKEAFQVALGRKY